MKQNIFLTVILLFILGCGAQNSPKEVIEDGRGQDNAMINENLLPQIITIKFPKLIEESPTLSVKENIKHVKNISKILENNLEILEKIMPKIVEVCQEKSICNFQKNYFTLEENISIGEIDFIKYEPTQPHQYEIVLKLTETQRLTYQWSEIKRDVISTYSNRNETLALHYFNDSNNSEALYINDTRSNEKNTFIISLEQTLSSTYHLRYNHIAKEHQNFSSENYGKTDKTLKLWALEEILDILQIVFLIIILSHIFSKSPKARDSKSMIKIFYTKIIKLKAHNCGVSIFFRSSQYIGRSYLFLSIV
jgi:hypothetical protein